MVCKQVKGLQYQGCAPLYMDASLPYNLPLRGSPYLTAHCGDGHSPASVNPVWMREVSMLFQYGLSGLLKATDDRKCCSTACPDHQKSGLAKNRAIFSSEVVGTRGSHGHQRAAYGVA